jgi:hypothetical protein
MIIQPITDIDQWRKQIFIASKTGDDIDDLGNSISVYDTPVEYKFNYRGVSSQAEMVEFGEDAKTMLRMVIPISYKNQFKEFDVAYVDGVTPEGEGVNGANANYRLLPPRNGGSVVIIYMKRINGK